MGRKGRHCRAVAFLLYCGWCEMANYFCIRGTKRYGPYSARQLKELGAKGQIKPDDVIESDAPVSRSCARDIPNLLLTPAIPQPGHASPPIGQAGPDATGLGVLPGAVPSTVRAYGVLFTLTGGLATLLGAAMWDGRNPGFTSVPFLVGIIYVVGWGLLCQDRQGAVALILAAEIFALLAILAICASAFYSPGATNVAWILFSFCFLPAVLIAASVHPLVLFHRWRKNASLAAVSRSVSASPGQPFVDRAAACFGLARYVHWILPCVAGGLMLVGTCLPWATSELAKWNGLGFGESVAMTVYDADGRLIGSARPSDVSVVKLSLGSGIVVLPGYLVLLLGLSTAAVALRPLRRFRRIAILTGVATLGIALLQLQTIVHWVPPANTWHESLSSSAYTAGIGIRLVLVGALAAMLFGLLVPAGSERTDTDTRAKNL